MPTVLAEGARAVALLLILPALVALGGCRPAARPGPAPAGAESPAASPSAETLFALIAAAPEPAALEGKGRLRIEVAGRELPALQARFALQRGGGAQFGLRPGVLSPVLSLWAGADAWSLRLPRQRIAFESDGGASTISAGELRDLGWFLFHPAALARRIRAESVSPGPAGWVVRGRLEGEAAPAYRAEIWIAPGARAIALWALEDEAGRALLRVAYEPAFEAGRTGGQISFICSPLNARGDLRFEGLSESEARTPPRPPLPAGWQLATVEEVPEFIESIARTE